MGVGFVVCMCVFQLCPAFCHPMDYSLPASFVREILQTKILEWVSFPSPGASSMQRLMYFSSSILVLFAILFLLLHSEIVKI